MQPPFYIRKIAVLGAGVMGAQIAAQCANVGFETLLFDLASKEGSPNALIEKAIAHLGKLKPAPLATLSTGLSLQAKNYENDLPSLKDCDLIIEAIAERLDWKKALYQRIAPFINAEAILVSNTSGLSINTLSGVLPRDLQPRFCGVHFFNPPRYMHLAELIPAKTTNKDLLPRLETWLTSHLGKGVVYAKDTPNFIANRIGVFSLLATLHHAERLSISLDDIDALTGTLLGRPKSATCRTIDVVGLDTMNHVVRTMQEQLKDDPWYSLFILPQWFNRLVEEGRFGQKTGEGIYRKSGKTIEVLDTQTGDYRAAKGEISAELKTIMSNTDATARMQALLASNDKQAQFLAACLCDLFHYCAYHLADIAETTRDVDLAMRWGFGWQEGPFETWQKIGVEVVRAAIENNIGSNKALLPQWLHANTSFYTDKGAFSPEKNQSIPRRDLPVYQRQFLRETLPGEAKLHLPTLFENKGVRLYQLEDNLVMLSFKSKANSIGQDVIDGIHQALDIALQQCQGMVIYQQDSNNFSAGADLRGVAALIDSNQMDALEKMLAGFQQVVLRLKYAPIPVVAALRGRALGGGCEILMHCDAVVAAFESYPGLVEAGVGLIPGGGGTKEMALRAARRAGVADLMVFIQSYFQQIATAVVAGNAKEAMELGFLQAQDSWVMHTDDVLYAAIGKIKSLAAGNYIPPEKPRFKVAGRIGHATLQAGLINWLEGGFISQHDYYLANQLAYVLCGGDVDQGTVVDETWMLNLERQAFMKLAANPLTKARISHVLETGKPLRN